MKISLFDKLLENLRKASQHNSQAMVSPEVVLWPDPDRQWESVIAVLQDRLPALLVLGAYQPEKRQGPAIWLKCAVARTISDASWPQAETPIIYMPGFSKNDLKALVFGAMELQPLAEYVYTGAIFCQANGREWTILALMENQQVGMGLKVTQDSATRAMLTKALPAIFTDTAIIYPDNQVNAKFLQQLLFPDDARAMLQWICRGNQYIQSLTDEQTSIFREISRSRYGIELDEKNIKAIVEQLGARRGHWQQVWQHFEDVPAKYPELPKLLRFSKPDDIAAGNAPEDSWPQINESLENQLRAELEVIAAMQIDKAIKRLEALETEHGKRRNWVWATLDEAALARALPHLLDMAKLACQPYATQALGQMQEYYINTGYKVDQAMRWSLAAVKKGADKKVIEAVIRAFYLPWLSNLTNKFQELVKLSPAVFNDQSYSEGPEQYLLFVDALRYELAMEFYDRLAKKYVEVGILSGWSAIPSLTPTAKPAISPLKDSVAENSEIKDFRPSLKSGGDLTTAKFRIELQQKGVVFVHSPADIQPGKIHWQEIGDIDEKGHTEKSGIVRRVDELFEQVEESLSLAFNAGIKEIRIVTDHGWLLMPGGLPKENLNQDLTDTRWGRCALIKEGAGTDLLQLPWRWNPAIYLAFAPGISFFKNNEEYAHGGLSIQECLVPVLRVKSKHNAAELAKIKDIRWTNLSCKIGCINTPDGYQVDIRTDYREQATSIVLNKGRVVRDNKITLMADDSVEGKAVVIVLLNEQGIILDKKTSVAGE
jgi:hypothetical protein